MIEKNILKAIIGLQSEMPIIKKKDYNPYYNSRYANLATVWETLQPLLTKYKLCVMQKNIPDDDTDSKKITVRTIVIHESGESIDGTISLIPVKNDPQGAGSAITYARRYGLMSLLCIVAEEDDDDGNLSSNAGQKNGFQKPQPKNTPKNTPTTELDTKIVSCIKKILGDCNPEEMQALFKMASAFVDTKTGEIKALSTMKGVSEKWKLTAYGKLKKLSDIPDVFLKAGEEFGVELKDLTPEQRDQLISKSKKRLNNDYDLLMPEY